MLEHIASGRTPNIANSASAARPTAAPVPAGTNIGVDSVRLVAQGLPSEAASPILSDGERRVHAVRASMLDGTIDALSELRAGGENAQATATRLLSEMHAPGGDVLALHPLEELAASVLMPSGPVDRVAFHRELGRCTLLDRYAQGAASSLRTVEHDLRNYSALKHRLPLDPAKLTREHLAELTVPQSEYLQALYAPEATEGTEAALLLVWRTRPQIIGAHIEAAQREFEARRDEEAALLAVDSDAAARRRARRALGAALLLADHMPPTSAGARAISVPQSLS